MTSKQQGGFSTNQMFRVEWRHCTPRVDKFPLHMEDWKRNSKKRKLTKGFYLFLPCLAEATFCDMHWAWKVAFPNNHPFLVGHIKLVSNRLYTSLPIASPWSSVMCHPVATLDKNTPFTSHYAFKLLYQSWASMIENRIAVGRGYMNIVQLIACRL